MMFQSLRTWVCSGPWTGSSELFDCMAYGVMLGNTVQCAILSNMSTYEIRPQEKAGFDVAYPAARTEVAADYDRPSY